MKAAWCDTSVHSFQYTCMPSAHSRLVLPMDGSIRASICAPTLASAWDEAALGCGTLAMSAMATLTAKKKLGLRSWNSCSRSERLTVLAASSSFVTKVTWGLNSSKQLSSSGAVCCKVLDGPTWQGRLSLQLLLVVRLVVELLLVALALVLPSKGTYWQTAGSLVCRL